MKRGDLPVGKEELEKLQAGDKTLEQIEKLAEEGQESSCWSEIYEEKWIAVLGYREPRGDRERAVGVTYIDQEGGTTTGSLNTSGRTLRT
uniref:Uncharacterized protein n=1 Tax=Amphimedon queenslandica TaxID=400682 RepID=A0A1X7TYQ3_AMPQE